MNRNVVIYIDEEQIALDSYSKVLKRKLPPEIEIISKKPIESLENMLKYLLGMRDRLASIILDEHLEIAGTASYIGTQLANAYRQIDNKIPIYILSNYPDEIDPNIQSVDYILSKDDFADGGAALDSAATRIVRHINAYDEIVDDRERRFIELLRKYISLEITPEESKEFNELKFWREAPTAIEESSFSIELKAKLDEQERAIQEIEAILAGKK